MRQHKIEEAYELGEHFEEKGNIEQAKRWYHKAAKAGYGPAAVSLADILDDEEQYPEAEFWYREGARTGDPAAVFNLAQLVSMRGDESQAQALFHLLIDNNTLLAGEAAYGLSQSLRKEGRQSEASGWLRKAHDLGVTRVPEG